MLEEKGHSARRNWESGLRKGRRGTKAGKIMLYLSKNQSRKRVQDRATKPDRLFFSLRSCNFFIGTPRRPQQAGELDLWDSD